MSKLDDPQSFEFGRGTATHARLTKVSTLPGAVIDPLGARGVEPIKNGYCVLGHYVDEPEVGMPFSLTRYRTNDVDALGIYQTSFVTKIIDGGFETLNSVYRLELL